MAKCWCGKTHPRGDVRNGEVKHWVINWKLYCLRHRDGEDAKDGGEYSPPLLNRGIRKEG
jgi:hypothetical protein